METLKILGLIAFLAFALSIAKAWNKTRNKRNSNVVTIKANCSVLLPHNKVADAHLVKKGEDKSVVMTEEFGKLELPNCCLRFVGSYRELNIKKASMKMLGQGQ